MSILLRDHARRHIEARYVELQTVLNVFDMLMGEGHEAIMQQIVLADADHTCRKMTRLLLESEGYGVADTALVWDILPLVHSRRAHLVIFDISMQTMSRFEVCRHIRRESDVALIFLAENPSVADRVQGLQVGGDDYIAKPYASSELLARVAAVLRRCAGTPSDELAPMKCGPLTIDPRQYTATHDHAPPITLTPTEFRLLRYLMQNANCIMTANQIAVSVWNYDVNARNLVSVYVRRLRLKIERDVQSPQHIATVANIGYMFVAPSSSVVIAPRSRAVGNAEVHYH